MDEFEKRAINDIESIVDENGDWYDSILEISSYYRDETEELDEKADNGELHEVFQDCLRELASDDFLEFAQTFELSYIKELAEEMKGKVA